MIASSGVARLEACFPVRAQAGNASWSLDKEDEEEEEVEMELEIQVDVLLTEEDPPTAGLEGVDLLSFVGWVEDDAIALLENALDDVRACAQGVELPNPTVYLELSVLLCGDRHIQGLNAEWRKKNAPTDVLSFPQLTKTAADESSAYTTPGVALLGDLVISLETAMRQAEARGHSLQTETRILMVHGLLHLLGHDHEGPDASALREAMAVAEKSLLSGLGWEGTGLIAASEEAAPSQVESQRARRPARREIKLIGLDMDGTFLNSRVEVSTRNAQAVRAAQAAGVRVFVATGKARPAAVKACTPAALVGDGGIVGPSTPGVFLQGLNVYGEGGCVLHQGALSLHVLKEAFEYSLKHSLPLTAFSGDRCFTLFSHPLLDELHEKYYEPVSEVVPSIQELMDGPPVNKLLYCAEPTTVDNVLRPHWELRVASRASLTQSQDDMLEILPFGASKGFGVKMLLDHFGVDKEQFMACGDGENDMEMLHLAGLGVAMGNAAANTLAFADVQVGTNDEDGVAEAIERYVLDPCNNW
eukprot:CAMPEP_0114241078 /NCGR_PEP_ID=MMETSP0058-20121206/9445_1 /TAXON_ID=36894 /ORGANISM="Pyramimonas parkeae, CCMP726" /LENGTH=529 /DNA_ID=CAMNT_0001353589 /DNA_START=221 /DNA_END=1810 /DNA_ORIENTATION=+